MQLYLTKYDSDTNFKIYFASTSKAYVDSLVSINSVLIISVHLYF